MVGVAGDNRKGGGLDEAEGSDQRSSIKCLDVTHASVAGDDLQPPPCIGYRGTSLIRNRHPPLQATTAMAAAWTKKLRGILDEYRATARAALSRP